MIVNQFEHVHLITMCKTVNKRYIDWPHSQLIYLCQWSNNVLSRVCKLPFICLRLVSE